MLRAYKTEIKPTQKQIDLINQTIGTCRWLYNRYIAYNKAMFETEEKFINANEFDRYIRHEFIGNNTDFAWIEEVSSKARKQAIVNAEAAFKRFFKKQSGFPKFKKRGVDDPKMYFVKTDAKAVIHCERHRIKVPTLGWVRLKEYGYLPTDGSIRSGTIPKQAGRFYVTVLVDIQIESQECEAEPLGVDLGIKDFAVVSNGTVYGNINKTSKVKRLEKKLKREQRKLSRKKSKKGEATSRNYLKQVKTVQKAHQRLANIRADYQNKIVFELVKTKPSHIAIEDLNVRGMMKNRHLSKAIAQQGFNQFAVKLTHKMKHIGGQVRKTDRWYPTSKRCHRCGHIKTDLKLSDRIFICEGCGNIIDRDYNASLNIRDCQAYEVAV